VSPPLVSRSALHFLPDRTPLMNRWKWSLTARLPQEHRFIAGYEYQRYTNDTDRSAFVAVTPFDRDQNAIFREPENRRGMEYWPCTIVLSFERR
jgi:hypothetical protein